MPLSTIRVLSCANGMPRLFDTFTAATNCPRLRKPAAAALRSVPAGRRDRSLLARLVFFCSFCCTDVNVVDVAVVGFDFAVLVEDGGVAFVVVLRALPCGFTLPCAVTGLGAHGPCGFAPPPP